MPAFTPSAQAQSTVRGVAPHAPGSVKHADPTRDRQIDGGDDRPAAVTLEPHWAATIDAATD
ncbi:MAG TPA: hypothetical protein VH374_08010 [Polyangia bacterium]|jgi:hypothetical protein|nr:hypothetical protein [Polyangia bacterium]